MDELKWELLTEVQGRLEEDGNLHVSAGSAQAGYTSVVSFMKSKQPRRTQSSWSGA